MPRWFRLVARIGALLLVAGGGAAAVGVVVARAAVAAAGVAVHVRRAGGREPARTSPATSRLPASFPASGRWLRWRACTRADRAIKAGNYEIASGITLPQLLEALTQGDATQTALTVVEGATFADVKRALRAQTGVAQYRCSTCRMPR